VIKSLRPGGYVVQSILESGSPDPAGPAAPRPRFCTVQIKKVVPETADSASVVLEPVEQDLERFAYRPGQYVTLRAVIDGVHHLRSYSMSSSPVIDRDLRVTIKRVPDGLVSNWVLDGLRPGDRIDVMPPTGTFTADETDRPLVAFAGGSGITPIFSILKDVLIRSTRTARLLFANHDRGSAIFGSELDAIALRHPDRFFLQHHADVDSGFVGPTEIVDFVDEYRDATFYICGPSGFMETVGTVLGKLGIDESHIRRELFTPSAPMAIDDPPSEEMKGAVVTISLGRDQVTVSHRAGTTILQTARTAGLRAPSSCESGTCATCMARVTEGCVTMRNNEALTLAEVAEGWVLTCQAEPTSPTVRVVYE
jgi:3-ketosteroid 9alpha-monooxygenase subunit B